MRSARASATRRRCEAVATPMGRSPPLRLGVCVVTTVPGFHVEVRPATGRAAGERDARTPRVAIPALPDVLA